MDGGFRGRLPFLGTAGDGDDLADEPQERSPDDHPDDPSADTGGVRVVARDEDWEDGETARIRPLAAVTTDEFEGFGVRTVDDRPDYDVPGTHRSRLHETASERFDLDAVPPDAVVAAVHLDASGAVVDVAWFADPVAPDTFRRDHLDG